MVTPSGTRTRQTHSQARTSSKSPGLFPGVFAGFPRFLPLFEPFSFVAAGDATARKPNEIRGFCAIRAVERENALQFVELSSPAGRCLQRESVCKTAKETGVD
jgi:hypothetical protein